MTNVSVCIAKHEHIDAIQRLYRQLDRHHVDLLPCVFQPVNDDARNADVVKKSIADKDADYLVAICGKVVVGFFHVQKRSYPSLPMFRPHHFTMIENAVVDRAHRGQGIGGALFDATIRWAKDRGLEDIQVTVWTANQQANRFYVSRGFQPAIKTLALHIDKPILEE